MNARLTRPLSPEEVYRERPRAKGNSDDLLMTLSFSGGGARAAALSYGVLKELARTVLPSEAAPRRLLDEVDLITAVSGGSFTAGYYGVHGDRIFTDFEPRFLRRRVGRALVLRLLSPLNWIRLASPAFGRSDLAAKLYDGLLFDGATFADINGRPGPLIAIQATDLVEGNRFAFSAHHFGLICSDISSYPVARAVAASAAFPIVFSPVLLRNYAGRCDYREPPWIAEALAEGPGARRRYRNARHLRSYADAHRRPWIYLVDGGVADNLGLHRPLDAVTSWRSFREFLHSRGIGRASRLVFVIVNAQTRPAGRGRVATLAPGLVAILDAVTSVQVNRYNFETVDLLRRSIAAWSEEVASSGEPRLDSYVIEVSFDALPGEEERELFSGIPTTLDLPDSQIDRLMEVGARILRESPDYRRLLRDLGFSLQAPSVGGAHHGHDHPHGSDCGHKTVWHADHAEVHRP